MGSRPPGTTAITALDATGARHPEYQALLPGGGIEA